MFASRAYFIFEKLPGELAVQSVRESDTGIYRCRIDYKVAQTKNIKVNLTIIGKIYFSQDDAFCHSFFKSFK